MGSHSLGDCCPHDGTPGPPVHGGRRTRWARYFADMVTRPYRERGDVISQGGYIQGPTGTFRSTPSGTRVPGGQEDRGLEKKSKFIYGYIGSFDPLEDFAIFKFFYYIGGIFRKNGPLVSRGTRGGLSCATWHLVKKKIIARGTGG